MFRPWHQFRSFGSFSLILSSPLIFGCAQVAIAADSVYQDTFATFETDFVGSGLSAKDGTLRIEAKGPGVCDAVNESRVFKDIDATVSISWAETNKEDGPGSWGGLICWAKGSDDYYVTRLANTSKVSVARWTKQSQWSKIVDWKLAPGYKQGLKEWNQLRVVTKGAHAIFYVNGEQAGDFDSTDSEGDGEIGLAGNAPDGVNNVWAFKDFKVKY
jgi:Domain of Unknown Function (DUF1080)